MAAAVAPFKLTSSVHATEIAEAWEYDQVLDDLFRKSVATYPDLVALDGPKLQMTYTQLDQATDKLAAFMRLTYGARPESVVGIFMDRCEEYVIALLAALKAGAAYCPVELAYPGPLLQSVFEQVSPCVTLSKSEFADPIPAELSSFMMNEGWQKEVQSFDVSVLRQDRPTPESLVYVVFSGGSTGKPKGIEANVRSCVASYLWRFAISGYRPGARVGCNVFFVWEILRPLIRGGAVVVVPDSIIFSAVELVDYLKGKQVTEILLTPSLAEVVLASMASANLTNAGAILPALQSVWLNGEVLTTKLLETAKRTLPDVSFYNTYSISECGEVCATASELDHSRQFCHVGKVATFCGYLVMGTETWTPVQKGEKGEMWVSGPGVGRGYLKNPKVTAERFVMRDGTRFYRTGDLARELPTGSFEILGRCDFMVKVRGYSVVLEAVEAAMLKRLGLAACCVSADGKEGEDKRLVAYLVPCHSSELHGRLDVTGMTIDSFGRCSTLFTEMGKEVPHYSVPSVYVLLPDGLPLIASSMKTDRKGLPPPPARPPTVELPAGTKFNSSEAQCVLLCEHVLSLPAGTLDGASNFFAYGGHSLLAARLITKLTSIGGPAISVVDFMKTPTPEGLLQVCTGKQKAPERRHLPKEVEKHLPVTQGIDVQTRAFWRFVVFTNSHSRVLLTGATGYVGAYLLKDLVETTTSQVFCLVRVPTKDGNADEEAKRRLTANLDALGLKVDMSCVRAIPGDVSVGEFGLSADEYMYMKQSIDVVIHAAAVVNLIYPYDLLEAANVTGTANVVDFARQGKVKALHYISTNGIFPEEGALEKFSEEDVPSHVSVKSGYGQSKWVAERIVAKAHHLGLPGSIYRLGNVGAPGGSSRGAWNLLDSNLLFVKHCINNRIIPDAPTWSMEFTPVDFISKFVIKAMLDLEATNHKTFHLINNDKMSLQQFGQIASRLGFALSTVSVKDWCATLKSTDQAALSAAQLELLMGHHHEYGQSNTQAAAQAMGSSYPAPNSEAVQSLVQTLVAKDLVASVKMEGRLSGKVGIVTGASSGIGKAVAQALAHEGMKVIMVSRSMAKLQEAAKSVPGAVCMTADVVDRKAVHAMVNQVISTFHQVDVLVNCAGVMFFTLMKNLHYDEWDQTIDINCKGTVNVAGGVFPHMLAAKKGHIINISSDAAKTVFPALTVYNAAKAFVSVFTKGLRAECVGTGLRVTDIQPGDTATNLIMTNSDQEAAEKMGVAIGKVVGDGGDRASVLDPEDIGAAVVYAVTAPAHVGIHELLIEPRDQMFGDPTAMNS